MLMSGSLLDKLKNFIMPLQEDQPPRQENLFSLDSARRKIQDSRPEFDVKPQLVVNNQAKMLVKIFVEEPAGIDDAPKYAERLKNGSVVLINYHQVDQVTKQRVSDFLSGVCYMLGGSVHMVSEQTAIYTCTDIDVDKVVFSYSESTYDKNMK
jgi:cell division inhibitor SepF